MTIVQKSKVQLQWEVYKEQEDKFIKSIEVSTEFFAEEITGVKELFTAIRGTEYRRGKEDAKKEFAQWCRNIAFNFQESIGLVELMNTKANLLDGNEKGVKA